MYKLGWLGGYKTPKSSAVLLFDRAHRTVLFDFKRNYAFVSYLFSVVASYLSKVASFNLPHLYLLPQLGVTPFESCQDLWRQKSRVPRYHVTLFA